jgi:hypothetical protein
MGKLWRARGVERVLEDLFGFWGQAVVIAEGEEVGSPSFIDALGPGAWRYRTRRLAVSVALSRDTHP